MVKKIMEASQAVAYAVQQCRPSVIPMYPITPQTHIVERLSEYINDGKLNCEMIHVDSEFSAISASLGASATGVRVFTATASQGLALMHEVLHIVSGMRLPIVMAVANRALSAPINIWNDHQDSISARDTGWIQLYVENSQEAYDTMIQSFKIAEDKNVLLPTMVCLDGFTLSHVFEPVDFADQKSIDTFLGKFKANYVILDPKKPATFGPVGFPNTFMQFKKAEQNAMDNALFVIKRTATEYKKQFKRSYGDGLIETYNLEKSKMAFVAMGTVCGTIKVVIDELKKKGVSVGLIKIKCYRPFPIERLNSVTKNISTLAVIDKNISLGYEGAVFTDVKSALYGSDVSVKGYIMGLGGKDITKEDLHDIANSMKNSKLKKGTSEKQEWVL